jgi:hypothetical protein
MQGDVNDGMTEPVFHTRVRALRMTPIGDRLPRPPLAPIIQRNRPGGSDEDNRTLAVSSLRRGDVAGARDESAEFRIGDERWLNPDVLDVYGYDRRLLGVEAVRTHQQVTTRNVNQVLTGGHLAPLLIDNTPG